MKKSRFTSLTVSLVVCASAAVNLLPASDPSLLLQPAFAKSGKTPIGQSATGLDSHALPLANRGNWSDLVDRLKTDTDGATAPSVNHAWLAFAYMFLDKGEDLKSLSQKVQGLASADSKSNVPKIVEVYNLICQKKLAEEATLGESLTPAGDSSDVVLDMALAAVSAKTGNSAKAIDYCNKAVTAAPDFAWGYRTIGFIEERTLKDNPAAEEAYQKALAVQPDFKEVRDLLVDLHIGRNDFDGALDVADSAVKANPHDPMNYYRLSQVYTQQWRLREADAALDKAIRLAPDNARFHRARASILRYQHKLTEAIAEQQRAVDLSSDKSFELTELAALNELAGNDSAAADNLKQAISLSPVSQAAHNAAHQKLVQLLTKGKRWDDLVGEYQRSIQLQPDVASLHLGLADAYLKADKIDEAEKELKTAADLDGNDPRPHRLMGAILLQKHDYSAAARAYTRALNINPGSVEDLVALGYTYAANDDYMQAETAFVTALALQQLTQAQGSREAVMRSLATLLLSEGRYTEAAINYEEIVRSLKNGPTVAQDALMLAESKALRDRTTTTAQEAIKSFEALPEPDREVQRAGLVDTLLRLGKPDLAIEQLGKLPDAAKQDRAWLILEARAHRMKGDLAQAEKYSHKSIEAKEDTKELQAAAYTELAHVLLAKGDLKGADDAIRKATDLNSKSFHAYEVMGRIYLKRNDTDHAIEAAKHATDINPYYTPAYILIGDAYQSANKLDQAANNYKRAVELYPNSLDAHRSLRDIYKKLAQKDELQKEEQLISQMEKNG
ncbi:MAG TPA: tetratricopeptide repeat protein [Candidatus Obscuribacterales bacterium]